MSGLIDYKITVAMLAGNKVTDRPDSLDDQPSVVKGWFDTVPVDIIIPQMNGLIDALLDFFYPIGTIYETVSSSLDTVEKMGAHFGGTWVAWGVGRVPVGVDTSQTEFNAVEKTGGHKATEAHAHNTGVNTGSAYTASAGSSFFGASGGTPAGQPTSTFGTGNAGNLQPYVTCYMWKRTA